MPGIKAQAKLVNIHPSDIQEVILNYSTEQHHAII
jgi:hypothetical protein